MYKILSDTNQVLGYVDKPAYIKQTSGGYTPAQPVEAIGLNFQGTLYNLLGHSEIEGAPTAYASMITETELLQILNSGTTAAVNAVNIMLGEA
mgnify:CR=1 FL=1